MTKKKAEETVPQTAEPKVKPVRLDLSPEDHHLLRKKAADANMSMSAFAKMVVIKVLKGNSK